ncbi:hypothetical protein QYE76_046069 [Lolium multiflorum]|uniref:CCHC-type domain-containing protein n=1 Tax=Lolium multiflorum TaxID=4521 RepID=A0AAD8TMP1_LOLMU|nr:hypothetical protein QYE76_046069 [Lolium multiflorum]
MFNKTEEPLDADDSARIMENNPVGELKPQKKYRLPPTTRRLQEPCTSARTMNAGNDDWEDFKLKFNKYHVPQGFDQEDERRVPRTQTRKDVRGGTSRQTHDTDGRKVASANENQQMMNQSDPTIPPPKTGGNNNNNHNNTNNTNRNNNNGNNNHTNTPQGLEQCYPITPKDKSIVNCYECGVVGHYSNECPKKLAKIAANTAAPAQQQRRFAGRRNQNNNNGRFYHMNATEAQEAPQAMPSMFSC